jgi:hypothetical protein
MSPWTERPGEQKDLRYFVGVDIGKEDDYTAIGILEQKIDYVAELHDIQKIYNINFLHRFEIKTEYPVIVDRIVTMFDKPELQRFGTLIVDKTGVGNAVVDMMRAKDLDPIGVVITGGHEVSVTKEGDYHVPKRDLVNAITVMLQSGRMKISKMLEHADLLRREMENFRVKTDLRTGHDQYEAWRVGEHDDLVMAVALASWYAHYQDRFYAPVEQQVGDEGRDDYDALTFGLKG